MFNRTIKRTRLFGALFCSGALLAVAAVPAATGSANQVQDGLVNVAIGDITIKNVKIGLAAEIIAHVCGVKVGPIAILARQIDRSGGWNTVCRADGNRVLLRQN